MLAFNLKGKVAVVTGSTSGIGKGIAEAFARAGADLVLHGRRSPDGVEAQRRELKSYGGKIKYHQADLTKPDEVRNLIGATISEFGKVDILVNNAGVQHVASIEEFPLEKWNEIIAVHQTAPFLATQAALPSMKAQGWGRIINIGSAQGEHPYALKSAYVTAKHGIIGFTKVTALESSQDGITCNVIAPGFVETPLVTRQIEERAQQKGISVREETQNFLAAQPSGRFTTTQQIADMALVLCSSVGANMNGSIINMDGGWTAGRPVAVNAPAAAALERIPA